MKFCGCATSRLRFYVKLKNGRYFICVGEQKTDDRRQTTVEWADCLADCFSGRCVFTVNR